MNSFFRWASILIAIGVLAGAIVYFVWLRAPGAVDGLVNGVMNGALSANATPVTSTETATSSEARLTVPTPAPQMLATPEPRQAVVIVPPPVDAEANPTAAALPPTPVEEDAREAAGVEVAISPLAPIVERAETEHDGDGIEPGLAIEPVIEPIDEPVVGNLAVPDHANESAELAPSAIPQDAAPALSSTLPEQEGDAASWLRPTDVRPPDSLAFGISTPEMRAQLVVPPVVTAIVVGEGAGLLLPTPTPDSAQGPEAEAVSLPATIQLYDAPDPDAMIPDVTVQRQAIDIIARDTTGRWYLLVDGLWIQADAVENPPAQLPLVVPTITPTPTNTGMPTPTEEPEPPTAEPPTPTPTPTSLDFPVCDCTPNTYACVTHNFRVRGEAQACFEYCFRVTGRDVHNLDPDGNGLACQSLPE